jgi:C1A family cysteine protease
MGQLTDKDISKLREQGRAEGWTFTVDQSEATGYALEDLCGLVVPQGWEKEAQFDPCTPDKSLPEAFDWRDNGGLPPVRNQGGCGSCWAFATVGPLECNIKLIDGLTVNLSEQWLVSCNNDDWDCGGGWWAHKYHQWKNDPCYETGAVLETDFPYAAANLSCGCPYPHHYRIESWAYIGSQSSIPAVDAMKQAILDHGPICVAVVSSSAMHAYHGGIFNYNAGGDVNHGVVLVGWDDNQGTEGVWIMRNSWGTWWGEEGGYMRMEYGVSRIGYGASYVVYPGALAITPASLPSCSLGVAYEEQLTVTGGTGDKAWYDRDGSLVGTGLSLSAEGLLSGVPMVENSISFVAAVEDDYDRYAEQAFMIEVDKYMYGDANADAEINVGDAVFMINFVFLGGPEPHPIPNAGDSNCDNNPNVADAVYVINYVFKNGPPPACQ